MVRTVAQDLPWPPSVDDFYLPPIAGPDHWFTKFTLFVWIATALIIVLFLLAYRNPKLVPTKGQWLAESVYGFVRDGVAKDIIGQEGIRFAPYLASLFLFILFNNLWGIIPGVQMSTNSHIAFPAFLAVLTYIIFNYVGVKKHGFQKYIVNQLVPPGTPWWLLPLLVPIEFASTFILRPVTLALRLFANMFAGHIILLVFTIGGFILFNSDNFALKGVSFVSWAFAVVLTLFELLVAVLQAYVFILLTAVYVQGAVADEH
jgi:F-type H+-transporting ATPase subunit a